LKKIVKKFNSFEEEEAEEIRYWRNIPGDKKLEFLEMIRAQYWAIKNETPARLQRVYRIIKQT